MSHSHSQFNTVHAAHEADPGQRPAGSRGGVLPDEGKEFHEKMKRMKVTLNHHHIDPLDLSVSWNSPCGLPL